MNLSPQGRRRRFRSAPLAGKRELIYLLATSCGLSLSGLPRIICAICLTLLWAANTSAQQVPLDIMEKSPEELSRIQIASVYGASKYLQKVTEAPSSVTIVTAEEIQKYGYRTLADILRGTSGFYVTYDRNYSYVGVRGFGRPGDYNSRILLLLNGHRLNENIYDGSYVGTEFAVDVDLIERVEVIRGPSSSLYGTNAFFAVINVITKRGADIKGVEVATEASAFDSYNNRISIGNRWDNGVELLLAGKVYSSHGPRRLYFQEFDAPATNHGIVENADGDRAQSLLADLSYRNFTLEANLVSRKKQIPTASFGTIFNDPRAFTVETRGFLDLSYRRTFANAWSVMGRLYYDHYIYVGRYPLSTSDAAQPTVTNEDFALGSWWGSELQVNKQLFQRHQLTGGVEIKDNIRQRQVNYDANPYIRYGDSNPQTKNFAFYLQDEYKIREPLRLSAGVRYDYYSTFGTTVNPRLGLIYQPLPKTTLKLLYGSAFRAPNAYELFYSTPFSTPNPDLQPERIKTSEVVLERYLGEHFRLSASGYHYRLSNLISQQTVPQNGSIILRNAETISAKGMEFEVEGKLASGFEGRVSYTFQQAANRLTGEVLTNSPRHLGKLKLSAPVVRHKIFASLDLQYVSKRRTLADLPSQAAPAYWLPNFTLCAPKLLKNLELSFSLYNLFDQQYGHPGGEEHLQNVILQDGRTWRAKLTYRFHPRQ